MKTINKEVLKIVAHKMMFDMDEEQYDKLLNDFSLFLKQLDMIAEVPNIDDVEPMCFPFEITTSYLREDEVESPLNQEEVLKNCKDVKDGQIKLPKVVG